MFHCIFIFQMFILTMKMKWLKILILLNISLILASIFLHFKRWKHRCIFFFFCDNLKKTFKKFFANFTVFEFFFVFYWDDFILFEHFKLYCTNKNFAMMWGFFSRWQLHTHTHWRIGIMIRVFANCPGDWGSILGWVITKTQKMVIDGSLLNTQHYKVRIKGKWSNPGKRVAPSSISPCSRYWKRSLWVTLKYCWPTINLYI